MSAIFKQVAVGNSREKWGGSWEGFAAFRNWTRRGGSHIVERKDVQDKTKKVVKDLEKEDTRLNGIVYQRASCNSKLAWICSEVEDNLLHALGGVSPDLVQLYKGNGRTELGKLLEKSLKALGFSDNMVAQVKSTLSWKLKYVWIIIDFDQLESPKMWVYACLCAGLLCLWEKWGPCSFSLWIPAN